MLLRRRPRRNRRPILPEHLHHGLWRRRRRGRCRRRSIHHPFILTPPSPNATPPPQTAPQAAPSATPAASLLATPTPTDVPTGRAGAEGAVLTRAAAGLAAPGLGEVEGGERGGVLLVDGGAVFRAGHLLARLVDGRVVLVPSGGVGGRGFVEGGLVLGATAGEGLFEPLAKGHVG